MKYLIVFTLALCSCVSHTHKTTGPKILIVVAHPDDDISFSGTVYKTVHHLGGAADIFMITNGEGGYKYSTLAENYYGLELTDEDVGRKHLPEIRKKELKRSGKIIGYRNYYFLDQKDARYTKDPNEVLTIWDVPLIKDKLKNLIRQHKYDYIFTLIPTEMTHGHHKRATLIALETIEELKSDQNTLPIILSATTLSKGTKLLPEFRELRGFPITKINISVKKFEFDRTQKFSHKHKLDYKIIANWAIAEHKSQGTMQLYVNKGDVETYLYYDVNEGKGLDKLEMFFERLKENQFEAKTYDLTSTGK